METRTEWEPPTLRAPLWLLDGFLPLLRRVNASASRTAQDARVLAAAKSARGREFLEALQGRSSSTGLGVRESCRMGRMPFLLLALGLYKSLREISRRPGL